MKPINGHIGLQISSYQHVQNSRVHTMFKCVVLAWFLDQNNKRTLRQIDMVYCPMILTIFMEKFNQLNMVTSKFFPFSIDVVIQCHAKSLIGYRGELDKILGIVGTFLYGLPGKRRPRWTCGWAELVFGYLRDIFVTFGITRVSIWREMN